MKLKEYQGKELFKKYGILIPKGKLITSISPNPLMIAKAQVLMGKRGKQGLILPGTKENLKKLFNHTDKILLEEKIDIEKEFYLALTIDKKEKEVIILFSQEGGIEVENAKKIIKIPYTNKEKISNDKLLPIITSMYKLMKDYNALLVEINPLVMSKGKFIALDSKIILDDNFQNSKFQNNTNNLENKAKENGFSYVDLDGNIAIIGNGAGLVMATLDMIQYFGGKASNFLDLGGGATIERVEVAIDIVLEKNPKVIFINVFGGITECDVIAKGLVNYIKKNKLNLPLIVRLIGNNEEKAHKILGDNEISFFDSMELGAKEAVKLANN